MDNLNDCDLFSILFYIKEYNLSVWLLFTGRLEKILIRAAQYAPFHNLFDFEVNKTVIQSRVELIMFPLTGQPTVNWVTWHSNGQIGDLKMLHMQNEQYVTLGQHYFWSSEYLSHFAL